MAESIKIPIEILDNQAIKNIQNFSKVVTTNLKKIEKIATDVSKIFDKFGLNFDKNKSSFESFKKGLLKIGEAAKIAGGLFLASIGGKLIFSALKKNQGFLFAFEKATKNTFKNVSKAVNTGQKAFTKFGKIRNGIQKTGKSFLNLRKNVKLAFGAIAAFAGLKLLASSFSNITKEAQRFENAMTGVISVANNFNISTQEITDTVKELSSDGLIPVAEVAASLKNLLARGFNLTETKQIFKSLKDSAAFGRQGFLTLGQAVEGATQGIKNGISNLVDNAGITKNLSVIQKEYASEIGKTVGALTDYEVRQSLVNGILKEASIFTGDAAKLQNNYTGAIAKLSFSFTQLLVELGEFITKNDLIISIIKKLSSALDFLRNVIKENRTAIEFLINTFIRLAIIATTTLLVIQLAKAFKLLAAVITPSKKSLSNLPFPTITKNLKNLTKNLTISALSLKLFGQRATTLSSFLAIGFKTSLSSVKNAVTSLGKSFILIAKNPIILAIAAITALIYGLVKALQIINQKTGIFTDLWNALKETFEELSGAFKPLIGLFKVFGKVIKEVATKAFGLFIFGLTKIISAYLTVINLINTVIKKLKSFSIFSNAFAGVEIGEKQLSSIEKAKNKLDEFSQKLKESNFDFRKLKDVSTDASKSINKNLKDIDLGPLRALQKELRDVGLTDLEKLKRQRAERLKVIEAALKSEGEAFKIAKELERKINLDFNNQLAAIRKKEDDKRKEEEKKRLDFIKEYKQKFLEIEKEISEVLGKIGQSATQAFSFAFGGGKDQLSKQLDLQLEKLQKRKDAGDIGQVEFDLEKSNIDKAREDLEKSSFLGIGTGIANAFSKGASGAKEIVSGVGAIAADFITPGLGQAVSPILNTFAGAAEKADQARKQIAALNDQEQKLDDSFEKSRTTFKQALADFRQSKKDFSTGKITKEEFDAQVKIFRAKEKEFIEDSKRFKEAKANIQKLRKEAQKGDTVQKQIKTIVDQFAQALPTLVEGIILSIPALIESIADNAPIIIERLVDRADDIIIALANAAPRVASKLAIAFSVQLPIEMAKASPQIAIELTKEVGLRLPGKILEGLKKAFTDSKVFLESGKKIFQGFLNFLKGIEVLTIFRNFGELIYKGLFNLLKELGSYLFQVGKSIIRGFTEALKDVAQSVAEFFYSLGMTIVQGFIDGLKSIGKIVGEAVGVSGGTGGSLVNYVVGAAVGGPAGQVVTAVEEFFGLARGGLVPGGFPNDSFPARLTSGELVVDRSTTQDLQEFLSTQGGSAASGGNETMIGLLSQVVNLLQNGQSIETSVDFEGDTLANIILNLNRNNARIA